MNQAIAHPYGANFKELINIFSLNKNKWSYKLKSKYTQIGLDSINTHYGQNIFMSDFNLLFIRLYKFNSLTIFVKISFSLLTPPS